MPDDIDQPEPADLKVPADQAQPDPEPEREPLPEHKDDLAAMAIDRGTPSYEAWAMTVPELRSLLEG